MNSPVRKCNEMSLNCTARNIQKPHCEKKSFKRLPDLSEMSGN